MLPQQDRPARLPSRESRKCLPSMLAGLGHNSSQEGSRVTEAWAEFLGSGLACLVSFCPEMKECGIDPATRSSAQQLAPGLQKAPKMSPKHQKYHGVLVPMMFYSNINNIRILFTLFIFR